MKHIVLAMLLVIPMLAFSQERDKGVQFVQRMNWKQVKEKAKAENKYILLDFFATWCGPCRQMDQSTYPVEKVGDFINAHFISVKIQMDTTRNDNEQVKNWYSDGHKLARQYTVNAYPTFLFFSPDGKIVHRAAGGYSASAFISLAKNATDTARQYYTQMAKYNPGKMSAAQMKRMADSLRFSGPELAQKVAIDYVNRQNPNDLFSEVNNLAFIGRFHAVPEIQVLARRYIKNLSVNDLKTKVNRQFIVDFKELPEARQLADGYIASLKEVDLRLRDNILFIIPFIEKPSGIAFKTFYRYSSTIDETFGVGYAESWTEGAIAKEEITPLVINALQSNGQAPDWDKLFKELQDEFGEDYAGRIINQAKCNWYSAKKDYKELFKSQVLLFDKYGHNTSLSFNLNNAAWSLFLRSNDTTELTEALSWSERAVKQEPVANWMDTYANLLYKLGRNEQATSWEGVAVKLEPSNKDISTALLKMKNNEPTWKSK